MAFFMPAVSPSQCFPTFTCHADHCKDDSAGNDPRYRIKQRRHQPRERAGALAHGFDPMMHHRHAMGEDAATDAVAMYYHMDIIKSFRISILK